MAFEGQIHFGQVPNVERSLIGSLVKLNERKRVQNMQTGHLDPWVSKWVVTGPNLYLMIGQSSKWLLWSIFKFEMSRKWLHCNLVCTLKRGQNGFKTVNGPFSRNGFNFQNGQFPRLRDVKRKV